MLSLQQISHSYLAKATNLTAALVLLLSQVPCDAVAAPAMAIPILQLPLMPELAIKFDGKTGKQKGEVKETASFQKWKAAEQHKMQKAAEKSARARVDAQFLHGPPNGDVDDPAPGGSESYGSNGVNALLNSPALTMVNLGAYRGGSGMTGYIPGSFSSHSGLTGILPSGAQSLLIGAALGTVPPGHQANLQSLIARELSKIKIAQPKIDSAALNKAISNAVKTLYPNKTQALKVLALTKAKMGEAFKINLLSKAALSAQGGKDGMQIPFGMLAMVDPKNLGKTLPGAQGQQGKPGVTNMFNEFGFAIPTLGPPPGSKRYHYDANGNLESMTESKSELSGDGQTAHLTQTMTNYDKAGYETGKSLHETWNGPNDHMTVDTTFGKDGTTSKHSYGSIKHEGTDIFTPVDITSKSKTVSIPGGFKTITDTVDLANGGLVSKTVEVYTGVKYHGGQMSEFNLKTTTTGDRMNWNPTTKMNELQTASKTSTLKQYASKFDSSGNMTSYKQDSWSSTAPDKHTQQTFNQSNFDSDHQYHDQTTETREKGTAADGSKLDSLSYATKTNIAWTNGKISSYTETTYTQQKPEDIGPSADKGKNQATGTQGTEGITGIRGQGMETTLVAGVQTNRFSHSGLSGITPSQVSNIAGQTGGGLDGTIGIGSTLQVNGSSVSASEGFTWGAENTSRSQIGQDYAGRESFYIDAKGGAHHTNYDAMGFVTASKDNHQITRQIQYDGNGNRAYWQNKDSNTGVKTMNWATYNALGQMATLEAHTKGEANGSHIDSGTKTAFTYDRLGNSTKVETELYNDSHALSFASQIAKGEPKAMIALVLAGPALIAMDALRTFSPELYAITKAAITIATAGTAGFYFAAAEAALSYSQGVPLGDVLKGFAINIAVTYATVGIADKFGGPATLTNSYGATIEAAAVSTSTTAGMVAVTTANVVAGATQWAAQTLVNTSAGVLQGQSIGQAFTQGAWSALGAVIATRIGGDLSVKNIKAGSELQWNKAFTEMGKEFLGQTFQGYANARGAGLDDSEAWSAAGAQGLGGVFAAGIGAGLQSIGQDGVQGFTPTGPQQNTNTMQSALTQQAINQAVQATTSWVFDRLKDDIGDKEASFLSQVAGAFAQAGFKNLRDKQTQKEVLENWDNADKHDNTLANGQKVQTITASDGQQYAKNADGTVSLFSGLNGALSLVGAQDKNDPNYLPGLTQGLAQTTLQQTLVMIADKVTKDGGFGAEFGQAFAASVAQNFNLDVFQRSLTELRAEKALSNGKQVEKYFKNLSEEGKKELVEKMAKGTVDVDIIGTHINKDTGKEEDDIQISITTDLPPQSPTDGGTTPPGGPDGPGGLDKTLLPPDARTMTEMFNPGMPGLGAMPFKTLFMNEAGVTVGMAQNKFDATTGTLTRVTTFLNKDQSPQQVFHQIVDGKGQAKVLAIDNYNGKDAFTRSYSARNDYLEVHNSDGTYAGVQLVGGQMLTQSFDAQGKLNGALLLSVDGGFGASSFLGSLGVPAVKVFPLVVGLESIVLQENNLVDYHFEHGHMETRDANDRLFSEINTTQNADNSVQQNRIIYGQDGQNLIQNTTFKTEKDAEGRDVRIVIQKDYLQKSPDDTREQSIHITARTDKGDYEDIHEILVQDSQVLNTHKQVYYELATNGEKKIAKVTGETFDDIGQDGKFAGLSPRVQYSETHLQNKDGSETLFREDTVFAQEGKTSKTYTQQDTLQTASGVLTHTKMQRDNTLTETEVLTDKNGQVLHSVVTTGGANGETRRQETENRYKDGTLTQTKQSNSINGTPQSTSETALFGDGTALTKITSKQGETHYQETLKDRVILYDSAGNKQSEAFTGDDGRQYQMHFEANDSGSQYSGYTVQTHAFNETQTTTYDAANIIISQINQREIAPGVIFQTERNKTGYTMIQNGKITERINPGDKDAPEGLKTPLTRVTQIVDGKAIVTESLFILPKDASIVPDFYLLNKFEGSYDPTLKMLQAPPKGTLSGNTEIRRTEESADPTTGITTTLVFERTVNNKGDYALAEPVLSQTSQWNPSALTRETHYMDPARADTTAYYKESTSAGLVLDYVDVEGARKVGNREDGKFAFQLDVENGKAYDSKGTQYNIRGLAQGLVREGQMLRIYSTLLQLDKSDTGKVAAISIDRDTGLAVLWDNHKSATGKDQLIPLGSQVLSMADLQNKTGTVSERGTYLVNESQELLGFIPQGATHLDLKKTNVGDNAILYTDTEGKRAYYNMATRRAISLGDKTAVQTDPADPSIITGFLQKDLYKKGKLDPANTADFSQQIVYSHYDANMILKEQTYSLDPNAKTVFENGQAKTLIQNPNGSRSEIDHSSDTTYFYDPLGQLKTFTHEEVVMHEKADGSAQWDRVLTTYSAIRNGLPSETGEPKNELFKKIAPSTAQDVSYYVQTRQIVKDLYGNNPTVLTQDQGFWSATGERITSDSNPEQWSAIAIQNAKETQQVKDKLHLNDNTFDKAERQQLANGLSFKEQKALDYFGVDLKDQYRDQMVNTWTETLKEGIANEGGVVGFTGNMAYGAVMGEFIPPDQRTMGTQIGQVGGLFAATMALGTLGTVLVLSRDTIGSGAWAISAELDYHDMMQNGQFFDAEEQKAMRASVDQQWTAFALNIVGFGTGAAAIRSAGKVKAAAELAFLNVGESAVPSALAQIGKATARNFYGAASVDIVTNAYQAYVAENQTIENYFQTGEIEFSQIGMAVGQLLLGAHGYKEARSLMKSPMKALLQNLPNNLRPVEGSEQIIPFRSQEPQEATGTYGPLGADPAFKAGAADATVIMLNDRGNKALSSESVAYTAKVNQALGGGTVLQEVNLGNATTHVTENIRNVDNESLQGFKGQVDVATQKYQTHQDELKDMKRYESKVQQESRQAASTIKGMLTSIDSTQTKFRELQQRNLPNDEFIAEVRLFDSQFADQLQTQARGRLDSDTGGAGLPSTRVESDQPKVGSDGQVLSPGSAPRTGPDAESTQGKAPGDQQSTPVQPKTGDGLGDIETRLVAKSEAERARAEASGARAEASGARAEAERAVASKIQELENSKQFFESKLSELRGRESEAGRRIEDYQRGIDEAGAEILNLKDQSTFFQNILDTRASADAPATSGVGAPVQIRAHTTSEDLPAIEQIVARLKADPSLQNSSQIDRLFGTLDTTAPPAHKDIEAFSNTVDHTQHAASLAKSNLPEEQAATLAGIAQKNGVNIITEEGHPLGKIALEQKQPLTADGQILYDQKLHGALKLSGQIKTEKNANGQVVLFDPATNEPINTIPRIVAIGIKDNITPIPGAAHPQVQAIIDELSAALGVKLKTPLNLTGEVPRGALLSFEPGGNIATLETTSALNDHLSAHRDYNIPPAATWDLSDSLRNSTIVPIGKTLVSVPLKDGKIGVALFDPKNPDKPMPTFTSKPEYDNYLRFEGILEGRVDYSPRFFKTMESYDAKLGAQQYFKGPLKEDMILLQIGDGSKDLGGGRSAMYWVSESEIRKAGSLEEYVQKAGLPISYGLRTHLVAAKIPRGTEVEFASRINEPKVGEAKDKTLGGGREIFFRDFDPAWLVKTEKLPSDPAQFKTFINQQLDSLTSSPNAPPSAVIPAQAGIHPPTGQAFMDHLWTEALTEGQATHASASSAGWDLSSEINTARAVGRKTVEDNFETLTPDQFHNQKEIQAALFEEIYEPSGWTREEFNRFTNDVMQEAQQQHAIRLADMPRFSETKAELAALKSSPAVVPDSSVIPAEAGIHPLAPPATANHTPVLERNSWETTPVANPKQDLTSWTDKKPAIETKLNEIFPGQEYKVYERTGANGEVQQIISRNAGTADTQIKVSLEGESLTFDIPEGYAGMEAGRYKVPIQSPTSKVANWDLAAYKEENIGALMVPEEDLKYYVEMKQDGLGNSAPQFQDGKMVLKSDAKLPNNKYIGFSSDIEGLNANQIRHVNAIDSIKQIEAETGQKPTVDPTKFPGTSGYNHYDNTKLYVIEFDYKALSNRMKIPDYDGGSSLWDIGGPRSLGGARQRASNQEIKGLKEYITSIKEYGVDGEYIRDIEVSNE